MALGKSGVTPIMRRRRPGGGRRRFKRMGNRGCGNRCGHNPADPRLTLAQPAHKRAPKILRALERHLIEYYDRPLSTLPSLAMAPVNGRQRQRLPDSARRESCLLLLMAMIKYLDLARLCVGVPTHEGFLTLKLEFLAQQAGLGLRRAERALRDLKAANIVTVSELCEEKEDGTYVGIAAVKAINKELFLAFGLGKWLNDERQRASQRQRDSIPGANQQNLAKLRLIIGTGGNRPSMGPSSRRVIRRPDNEHRPRGPTTGPPDRSTSATTRDAKSLSDVVRDSLDLKRR